VQKSVENYDPYAPSKSVFLSRMGLISDIRPGPYMRGNTVHVQTPDCLTFLFNFPSYFYKILFCQQKTCQLLDGVFGFMIVDTKLQKVNVARDTCGVRPLFYFTTKSSKLGVCSEAKGKWWYIVRGEGIRHIKFFVRWLYSYEQFSFIQLKKVLNPMYA